jgi:enoyl-CoA hydratase
VNLDSYTTLKLSRRGRILNVSFNRPDALNSIDQQMHAEVVRCFSEMTGDPGSDVVILSGVGRAFSAGGDFQHMQDMVDKPSLFLDGMHDVKRLLFSLLDCPKPVIAKLNGHAIGLGATIALFCDLAFAVPGAKIGDPHVRVGLVAGDGGAVIWPHLLGHARAKEYLLTGRPLLAEEAERIGLINRVVAAEQIDAVVDAFADELASSPKLAVQWTKMSINIVLKQQAQSILDASVALEALSNATQDHAEAVKALRKKRAPVFTGG